MTATYLLYTRTGKEFQVAEDLALIGIEAWVGRVLEGKPDPKRAGRKRVMVWHERPKWPNVIFATMTAEQYHMAMRVKHVWPTTRLVSDKCMNGSPDWVDDKTGKVKKGRRGIIQEMAKVDAEYAAALKAKERGEQAPPSFKDGQSVEGSNDIIGPLVSKFRGIVEDADGFHLLIDAPNGWRVKANPADVRAAE